VTRPYVVRISANEGSATSHGTGACVASVNNRTLILTANHVIRDAPHNCKVLLPSRENLEATLIYANPLWDIALLVIRTTWQATVSLGDRRPSLGQKVTLAGFGSNNYLESSGRVTGYSSPGGGSPEDILSLSAIGRPGDSGGPLLSTDGRILGVLIGSNTKAYGTCCTRIRDLLASVVGIAELITRALRPAEGVFYGH
jgi:S1-C subfamily serine protease